MKNIYKKLLTRLMPFFVMLFPVIVSAQGLGVPPQGSIVGVSSRELLPAITRIVNVFLMLAGLVAVIMLIFGGVRYIISGGDSTAQESAKNTILYAIVGLIVIGLSYAIAAFVIGSFQS